MPLSEPDPLAPARKPVPDSVIKDLLKGKYTHINSLIRQPQETSSHTVTHDHALGGGITLTTTPRAKHRVVESGIDFMEAYLSTVLPACVQLVQHADTLAHAHAAADKVQQHVCFLVAATVYFRRYGVENAIRYLESHRDQCTTASTNLVQPYTLKLHNMLFDVATRGGNSYNNNSSSSSSGGGSSSSAITKNGGFSAPRPARFPADGSCGRFNSHAGCQDRSCTYRHECRTCKSTEHGQTKCAKWKPTFAKRTGGPPTHSSSSSSSSSSSDSKTAK